MDSGSEKDIVDLSNDAEEPDKLDPLEEATEEAEYEVEKDKEDRHEGMSDEACADKGDEQKQNRLQAIRRELHW